MTTDDHEIAEAKLLEIMNTLARINPNIYKACAHPIAFGKELSNLEKRHDEVCIAPLDGEWVMSVPALISTITQVLCGRKLAFSVDENEKTIGFQWLK